MKRLIILSFLAGLVTTGIPLTVLNLMLIERISDLESELAEQEMVYPVSIDHLLRNPHKYEEKDVVIDGNISELSIHSSPPWLAFVIHDDSGKISVQGPSKWVNIRITPLSTEKLREALTDHVTKVIGTFDGEGLIIAKEISIKVDSDFEKVWALL